MRGGALPSKSGKMPPMRSVIGGMALPSLDPS